MLLVFQVDDKTVASAISQYNTTSLEFDGGTVYSVSCIVDILSHFLGPKDVLHSSITPS